MGGEGERGRELTGRLCAVTYSLTTWYLRQGGQEVRLGLGRGEQRQGHLQRLRVGPQRSIGGGQHSELPVRSRGAHAWGCN